MANFSSYTFDNMSRIGLDECSKSQTDIQNVESCNYMTQNYFASDCSMKNPISLATTQPGIMYNGGHNVGAGGCNINDSSKLQIGTIQTHPRCRIDLFHRPFATVPYLGRGAVNPIIESQIQQGETGVNKRSVTNLSEKSYIKYHQTPLLPSVKDRLTNPANSVEGVASEGWIRGGVPSRELTRDKDYFNKHSTYQYV
uniref:Uncharacterized protein n=1 Tax=viral metagenome TaxID=1070528 RepID=A0A6C0EQ43_9ZZZZ